VSYSTAHRLGTALWKAPFAFVVAVTFTFEATFASSIVSRVEVAFEGRARASLGCHIGTQPKLKPILRLMLTMTPLSTSVV